MSNVKFTKIEKQSFTVKEMRAFGFSMLDGIRGDIVDCETGKLPEMKLAGNYTDDAIESCTERVRIGNHIDVMCPTAEIAYDMGREMRVEKAALKAYYHEQAAINYSLGEFKLYASNNRDDLFNSENEVAHECGKDSWFYGARNNADWVYNVNGSFRYFGIKVLNSNPTDDIIRIGYIGLFNDKYTQSFKYLLDNYPDNVFAGQQPQALTDNCVFDDDAIVNVDGEQKFTFDTCGYDRLSKIWVIGSGDLNISVDGFPAATVNEILNGRKEYIFETEGTTVENCSITVTVNGNGSIDQIGGFCKNRAVKVELDDVICDDFMGIGTNVLPLAFMPENMATGYNEVYWQLERERIRKTKPHIGSVKTMSNIRKASIISIVKSCNRYTTIWIFSKRVGQKLSLTSVGRLQALRRSGFRSTSAM